MSYGVLGASLGALPAYAADASAPAAPEAGVWQQHKYSFEFLGFTSTYSCDGLADKLRVLLIAAGARPDAKSRPGACAASFGRPDKFARADLIFYTLTPTGSAAASNADGTAPPIDGLWRQVSFASHTPRELATGDCELIEQFKSSVLPMFTVRNVDSRTTCIPHQDSGSVIDLKFDSFEPAQKPSGRSSAPKA
jgi:hypothetical protein